VPTIFSMSTHEIGPIVFELVATRPQDTQTATVTADPLLSAYGHFATAALRLLAEDREARRELALRYAAELGRESGAHSVEAYERGELIARWCGTGTAGAE
jgi:hypothetical protein